MYLCKNNFCRFAAALGGLAMNEIIKRTTDRLETVRAEGVHVCRDYEELVDFAFLYFVFD